MIRSCFFLFSFLTATHLTAASASALPLFVNELHYDNSGADIQEGVEIAGLAGSDLTGWRLSFYNGGDGRVYKTVPLGGTIPDQLNGVGTLAFAVAGIQNGAADGLGLVDPLDNVVQFLSYEGQFTASDGPAAGLTSVDIGVVEDGSSVSGFSLQLVDAPDDPQALIWIEGPASFGAINTGQTFAATSGQDVRQVPEPSQAGMLAAASALALWLIRRRQSRHECSATQPADRGFV